MRISLFFAFVTVIAWASPTVALDQCREPSPGRYACQSHVACGYLKEGKCHICLCLSPRSRISPETCKPAENECNWDTGEDGPPQKKADASFVGDRTYISESSCQQRRNFAALRAANKPYPSIRYSESTLTRGSVNFGFDDQCAFADITESEPGTVWTAVMDCYEEEEGSRWREKFTFAKNPKDGGFVATRDGETTRYVSCELPETDWTYSPR